MLGARPLGRTETWRNQRERRFCLQLDRLPSVIAALEGQLPQVSYVPGSTRTFVATTYLDSKERDYLAIADRSQGQLSLKMRVREYIALHEANGQPQRLTHGTSCFLERKERVGETRVKQRIELAKADIAGVLRGERPLNGEATVVRSLMAELTARALEPVLVSGYIRRVYGTDRGLRVTLDDHLGFHVPPPQLYESTAALTPDVLGEPAGRGPAHILEVKEPTGSDTPAWLIALLDDLESADRFSKFRDGMRVLEPAAPGTARASG
ncbi:MAG TPA: VTC domain-containing protein [Kofleriaceae bacterium]|nr:VTC domain-containing protein [Kofleriaceae bacterium]